MKKSRRKRNFKLKNVVLLVLAIISINSIFLNNNSYSKVEVSYKTELISSGDTLWSIAQRESKINKYYQDKDIREIVYDLKQVNNLQASDLSVGQEIQIPKI
ncbi:MAG: LysM peptidoglycan-binding domain-containing protein [Clostridia bacterium]|nr:LysM peptidoglycan-binding domain-containing protein [Clostridia bacterium]